VPAPDQDPDVDLPLVLPIDDGHWRVIDQTYVPYVDWYDTEPTGGLIVALPAFSLTDGDYIDWNGDSVELTRAYVDLARISNSAMHDEVRAATLISAHSLPESLSEIGDVAPIPEPSGFWLFVLGVLSSTMRVRRDSRCLARS
jgi:hypothetical protein